MAMAASRLGAAGEHIVCADILLSGRNAFFAGAALPFDLVIDDGGRLARVAVKSTLSARKRPAREANRICYQFAVTRSRRLHTGKTDARPYSSSDVDIIAFCALDVRCVAYCHISECAQSMHFDPPGMPAPKNKRGYVPGRPRKGFDNYTLERALAVHRGEIKPFPFKWRAA